MRTNTTNSVLKSKEKHSRTKWNQDNLREKEAKRFLLPPELTVNAKSITREP